MSGASMKCTGEPRRLHLSGAQRMVWGQGRALGEALERHRPWIEAEARRLAGRDERLAVALVRRALDRILELDATRFGENGWEYFERELRLEMRIAGEQLTRRRAEGRVA